MSSNRVSHFHCMDFIDMYEGASFNFIFFLSNKRKNKRTGTRIGGMVQKLEKACLSLRPPICLEGLNQSASELETHKKNDKTYQRSLSSSIT